MTCARSRRSLLVVRLRLTKQLVGEGHQRGVLHRPGVEVGDEDLVVGPSEGHRPAEERLLEVQALPGDGDDLVGLEVRRERGAAPDAEVETVVVGGLAVPRPAGQRRRGTAASARSARTRAGRPPSSWPSCCRAPPSSRERRPSSRRWPSGRAGRSRRRSAARRRGRTGRRRTPRRRRGRRCAPARPRRRWCGSARRRSATCSPASRSSGSRLPCWDSGVPSTSPSSRSPSSSRNVRPVPDRKRTVVRLSKCSASESARWTSYDATSRSAARSRASATVRLRAGRSTPAA